MKNTKKQTLIQESIELYESMYCFDSIQMTDKVYEIIKMKLVKTTYNREQIAKAIIGYLALDYLGVTK